MDIVVALLQYYSFDLGSSSINELISDWNKYEQTWVRLAIVESLHQGRYKAVSVSQILNFWQRRGEPQCRFNHEFERLVCGDFRFSSINQTRKVSQPLATPASTSFEPSANGNARPKAGIPMAKSDPKPQPELKTNLQPKSPAKSQNNLQAKSSGNLSGKSSTQKAALPSPSYKSVVQMKLLADSCLFVDKLRAICQTSNPNLVQKEDLVLSRSNVSISEPYGVHTSV
jgi:hypothetical protein